MATRRYKLNAGQTEFNVVEEVGAATDAATVELTVDTANTEVNEGSGTRQITRDEVLRALDMFKNHILRNNWPPSN